MSCTLQTNIIVVFLCEIAIMYKYFYEETLNIYIVLKC